MQEPNEVLNKHYEIGFLVATEEAAPELAAFVKKYVANVTTEGSLRRIRLAYAINKETSAVFGFFQFMAAPEKVKQLEQDLRTHPLVIRSLIVKLPKASKSAPRRDPAAMAASPRPSYRPQASRSAPEQPKVVPALSNEALEKKIEEILQ